MIASDGYCIFKLKIADDVNERLQECTDVPVQELRLSESVNES